MRKFHEVYSLIYNLSCFLIGIFFLFTNYPCCLGDCVRGSALCRDNRQLTAISPGRHEQVLGAAGDHLQERPQQLQAEDQQTELDQGLRAERQRELLLLRRLKPPSRVRLSFIIWSAAMGSN